MHVSFLGLVPLVSFLLELEFVKSSKLALFSIKKNEFLKSLKCLVFSLMRDTEGYTLLIP